MSTVGLSFGSATSGAGFDVSSTVASIIAIEQGIETPWKTHLTALQAQDTVLTELGTDLGTLSTAISSLTAADGVLAQKEGSSSNSDALALSSADTSAAAGSHTISVTSLAQTSSNYTDTVVNAGDTLSGSVTIQVGSASAQTVTVDSSSNTLATLAAKINAGSYGVTASVISDANGSRLSLVSQTAGLAGQLTISPSLSDATTSTAIAFYTGQSGANAVLTVDNVPVSSASNTVTGAIPGVTFQLLAPATNIQVQITNDNTGIETAVQALVTAYNAVIADIAGQEKNDSSGNPEPLYGSPTLSLIQTQLSSALFGGTASGAVNNLTQLGIAANQDGTLTFTSSTLDALLNSNFTDVTGYLQSSGSWGQSFLSTLNQLGNTDTTGVIAEAQAQNSTDETALNASVTAEDARIATDKTNLTAELTTANQELQGIPEALSEQNELYSAITGYNTNPA
jgi:flagellar hook-associated protein 2